MPYASEEAFRAGLKARLSAEARTSRFSRDELARAVTLQLFLARLFRSPDADQWILTGGTALQFRVPTQARPTADADLATRTRWASRARELMTDRFSLQASADRLQAALDKAVHR